LFKKIKLTTKLTGAEVLRKGRGSDLRTVVD
jgi:hypothetical protein